MSNLLIKAIGSTLNTISHIAPKYASKKAIDLFATPRKGNYNPDQTKIIDSAIYEELSYNQYKIATYRWDGRNKTILLAHGWESNTSRWEYILEDLKTQDFNIIALDAPAHGMSSGKQFNAILYSEFINIVAQKFQPEIIIGHSVGGMATVFCLNANKLPSVEKTILLGAPAHFRGVFTRYKTMMGYNEKIANGLDSIVLERFEHPVDHFSAADFTKTFEIKGLIIHDKEDAIIPYEDAKDYERNYKHAKLITTNGFGHGLKDTSLIPKIIAFINR